MHVHLNCFDYDKLLTGIVEHFHMEDTPLTSEYLEKVFKELSEKFNQHHRNELTPEETKLVEDFLKTTITYADFDGDEEVFKDIMGEDIAEALATLEDILTDPEAEVSDRYNQYVLDIIENPNIDLTDDGPAEFISSLSDNIVKYMVSDFNAGEMFILGQIEAVAKEGEIIRSLLSLPVAGKTVKYGDSLITFPIILIEVTE